MIKLLEAIDRQIAEDLKEREMRGTKLTPGPSENNSLCNMLAQRILMLNEVKARLQTNSYAPLGASLTIPFQP